MFDFINDLVPHIGIDLGTANILVFVKGKGIVLNEPSVVAKNTKNNRVISIGKEAEAMIGRTPMNMIATKPMKDGVIADYTTTKQMLDYIIKKVCKGSLFKPVIVIAVPSHITQVEKRAVKNAALESGMKEVYIIEEPWAAAIGAGLAINEAGGNMVVDIGGGTTDIAVLSLNGIVLSDSERIGGNKFDEVIKNYIKKQYSLLIGDPMAELIKVEVGSAYKLPTEITMEVKGRDLVEGSPKTIKVNSVEIREILQESLDTICQKIKLVLEKTPPDLCADIIERGIMITGGSSMLRGLDKLIFQATKVPVHLAEDPLLCVANGCGKALGMIDKIKNRFIEAGGD